MIQYGDRETVKTVVRDLVRPGTFNGDCGIIAFAVLAGTTYGDALYACRAAGFVKGEGINSDDLARAIRERLGDRADEQLRLLPGANLTTFLAEHRGWTGLAIIAGTTGHAVPVVDGFVYNADPIHATLPLVAVQDVR